MSPAPKKSKSKKKKPKKSTASAGIYNIAIAALAIVVIGFIASFIQRSFQSGVSIPNTDYNSVQPQLAVDLYEANPISDIQIEILNGCGVKGIAGKFADFLREEHQIDVVRSENADNFNYSLTTLIQRNENVDYLKKVAKALDFNINNEKRVLIQPRSDFDVDMTLIIGKDYASVKPLNKYLESLP